MAPSHNSVKDVPIDDPDMSLHRPKYSQGKIIAYPTLSLQNEAYHCSQPTFTRHIKRQISLNPRRNVASTGIRYTGELHDSPEILILVLVVVDLGLISV